MSESHWRAIFEQILILPEQQQARLQIDSATLLVERRGHVIVALREVPSSSEFMSTNPGRSTERENGQHWQLLQLSERRYLCAWRRQPNDWDWLKALASVPF